MGTMMSQITSLTIVYSTVYSGADQRKQQRSASVAFARGFHRWPVNSPHKGPVMRKTFPFDDFIMFDPYIWERVVSLSNNWVPQPPTPTPTALVPVKFPEMQRGKLQVSPKHKETQAMGIYLGIYRIALFWILNNYGRYIWLNVFVFVFVFESMYLYLYLYLNQSWRKYLYLYLYLKNPIFLYLYLYLYLIKRIWPQPWIMVEYENTKPKYMHMIISVQWRHNERDCLTDHGPHDCLLNRLLRHRSRETSKLRVTGLSEGNSPMTGEFLAQRVSNTENVSIWWRHHVNIRIHWVINPLNIGIYTYILNIYIYICTQALGSHTYWYMDAFDSAYSFIRANSRLAANQWETSLQSNTVSHWLGANLESALFINCCHLISVYWYTHICW